MIWREDKVLFLSILAIKRLDIHFFYVQLECPKSYSYLITISISPKVYKKRTMLRDKKRKRNFETESYSPPLTILQIYNNRQNRATLYVLTLSEWVPRRLVRLFFLLRQSWLRAIYISGQTTVWNIQFHVKKATVENNVWQPNKLAALTSTRTELIAKPIL